MALALPLVFVPLSGCVDCTQGPPVSARDITSGDEDAGGRAFALDILVTDGPGGPPLPGAGVVAYYGGTDANDWSGSRVQVGPDSVLIEPVNDSRTTEAREVLRMLTGAEGRATAHVPGNRIIGVVVAKEGYTEEWVPAVAAGSTGAQGSLTIALYRAQVTLDMDAVWAAPGAASTGEATSSDYAWDPHPVPFGSTTEAARGYAARIVELTVTVSWTNAPTGAGDLGVGAGPAGENPRFFEDAGNNVAPGAQSVRATLDVRQLEEHGILGAPAVVVGAATDSGFVAPFGLPYTMVVEARFDTALAAFGACSYRADADDSEGTGASVPAWGMIGAMGALSGGALLRRR